MNSGLFYKVVAILIFVIGATCAMVLGIVAGIDPADLWNSINHPALYPLLEAPRQFDSFSVLVMLPGLIGSFFTGLVFFWMGVIVRNQELIIQGLGIIPKQEVIDMKVNEITQEK